MIKFKYLIITKPIKIKGKAGSILEITEGPIIINIEEKYENEFVIFSELSINFNIDENNQNVKINKSCFLFKLFPGSLLEIEDCNISCKTIKKTKIICFQINSKITFKNEPNERVLLEKHELKNSIIYNHFVRPELNMSISILTLRCTKITNFYQSIRAGENVILNIEKCFINNNLGKAIVILNPIITKIVESTFESNMENAIHIKFVKDEFIGFEMRKLYFEKNEILYNFGYGIYIDGIENFPFEISILVLNNNFKKNCYDGLFISDLYLNSLTIEGNTFKENKSNGLNLQKLNRCASGSFISNINNNINSSSSSNGNSQNKDSPHIIIKNNVFSDSEGFGVFLNDCRAIFLNNEFIRNKASGIILCNINFYELYKETKSTNIYNSSNIDHGTSYIQLCNFIKNGGSGIKVFNYSFNTVIVNCKMIENCEFGLQIENEVISTESNKNALSKSNENSNSLSDSNNVYLKNSHITSNMKSGICLINNTIKIEHTVVSNNLDYAIYIPKEEHQQFIHFSDELSGDKLIHGNIGGPWGEIYITKKKECTGCTSNTQKTKKVKIFKTKAMEISPKIINSDNAVLAVQKPVIKIDKPPNTTDSKCLII